MARLLVSVRDSTEAIAAVAGGAAVIDVKEPGRGPLGQADPSIWRAVRAVVPAAIPVSVALGELVELGGSGPEISATNFTGIAFRKLGLSAMAADPDWSRRWADLRAVWAGPAWVAVAYADYAVAAAPDPDAVIDAALGCRDGSDGHCVGLLIDTWKKGRPTPLEPSNGWARRVGRARAGGLMVALAGGLAEADIRRLTPLAPDLFAVRGAACIGGRRLGPIDPGCVARLARLAAEA